MVEKCIICGGVGTHRCQQPIGDEHCYVCDTCFPIILEYYDRINKNRQEYDIIVDEWCKLRKESVKQPDLEEIIIHVFQKCHRSNLLMNEDLLYAILYLADWYSSVKYEKPITKIQWVCDTRWVLPHSEIHRITIRKMVKRYDEYKCGYTTIPQIDDGILSKIIEKLAKYDKYQMRHLVYFTYPVVVTSPGEIMNLTDIAACVFKKYG